ncbi:hypothetical protein JCM6882_004408 [Rhodosporidiobolus microsporus]
MASLSPNAFSLPPLPPSPAACTSTRSGGARKRSHSPLAAPDEAVEPATKKRAVRSTAAEKAAKKSARMERNRIAAQVSRDRKKEQTQVLEARVAELEAQLATSSSAAPITPSPSFTLPALPTPSSAAAADPLVVGQLKEENESLRTQLALEKLASQALQIRLSSLEAKFGRLEQLLSGGGVGGATGEVTQQVVVRPEEKEQKMVEEAMDEKESAAFTRGRPVPAAEAVPPVVNHHHQLHLDPLSSSSSSSFDFSLPGLQLDFDLDLVPAAASTAVAAPDPLVDQGLPLISVDGDVSSDVLAQAWAEWANQLDPAAFVNQPPVEDHQQHQQAGEDFDLFEFLSQDAAAGSAAVEVGC